MKRNAKVSTAVIRRLPRYYRHLSELQEDGVVRISSSGLGKSMGLTASQIRQDLFCFGGFGQQGYGYKVDSLKEEIGEILGISRGHTLVVFQQRFSPPGRLRRQPGHGGNPGRRRPRLSHG